MRRKQIWKRRVFAFLLAFTVICTSGNSAFYSYAEEAVEEKKEEAPKEEKKEEAPKEEKKEEAPKEEKKEEAPKEEGGESGNEGSSEGGETGNEGSSEGSETGNEGNGEDSESGTEEGGTEELETEETEELETEELETEELETEELETEELETEETEEAVITEYVYEDSQVIVTATLSDAAAIPDEAEFVVERIGEGSSRYKELEAMAAREIGESKEVKNILAYDMRFELEGKEIEPAKGTVSVTVVYKEKEQLLPAEELANEKKSGEAAIETGILHVKDGGEVEQLSGSVNMDGEGKVESAGFETDSFSEIVLFGANASGTLGNTDATYNGSFELEYILNNFNIFVKDELISKNHIVGEIMAGGDSQVAHIGGDYASGTDKTRIYRWKVPGYVKGKAAVPGDEVSLGKPLYKGLVNMPANPTSRIYTDDYMDFGKAFSSINSQCSTLLADSSAIRVQKGDSLILTEGSNYIIEADAWGAITICNSTGDRHSLKGLPTVITVEGEGEFSFSGVGYGVKNNDWYSQSALNAVVVFPNATKVNLQTGGNAVGHLVAPKAKVSVTMGGNYNGSIVAKSLNSTGNTEFHKRHWSGDIKTDKKTISISGKKTWVNLPVDLNDQNAAYWNTVRVVVGLYANGQKQDEVTISKWTTAPAAWSYQFSDLPEKDSAGKKITYTVKEEDVYNYNGKDKNDKITDYWASYDGYNIINTYGEKPPESVTVSGTKTWVDDTEAVRPGSIEVTLYEGTGTAKAKVEKDVNGKAVINPVTVKPDADGNWKYEFTNLAKEDAGKNVIAYSVEETAVTNYTTTYPTNSDAYVLDIVNTYQKEKIDLSGKKTWIDYEDNAGGQKTRPDSITVILMNGSTEVARKVVKAEDNWEYSFTNLDKYNVRHEEIKYTVKEETVPDGYKVSYFANSIDITNSLKEMDYTFWTVNKVWDDENNNDGVRPNSLQVTLYGATTADNKAAVTQDAEGNQIKPVILSESNNWSYTFTKLPKVDASGNKIIYSAEEEKVNGYNASVMQGANSTTFTNKYDCVYIDPVINKVWVGDDGNLAVRPDSIEVRLYADGNLQQTITVSASDNWRYAFGPLHKYKDGREIAYTITETAIGGYTALIEGDAVAGWRITNTYEEEEEDGGGGGGGGGRTRRGGGGGGTTTISDGPVPLAGDVLGANRAMQEYALPAGEVLGETRTPGTGDAANPWMWGMVMMFSAAFLAVGAGVEKRKKNK